MNQITRELAVLALGLILCNVSARAQTAPAAPPPPSVVAPQKIGGVSFTTKRVAHEGATIVVELAAEAEGTDIAADAFAADSTLIMPSGTTVHATYVQIGDSSGRHAVGTFLAGQDHRFIIKWPIADETLKELPRLTIIIRLAKHPYDLKYANLKVE